MNKWHNIIRSRLAKYRKECLSCLYPQDDYEWGTKKENLKKTLALVNKIAKGISMEAWPDKEHAYKVANGRWCVTLEWTVDNKRTIDLKHRNNDHTAWCVESKGQYKDYDIGGS